MFPIWLKVLYTGGEKLNMEQLMHIVYASAATHPFDDEELIGLLTRARQFNHDRGVTGMLLYCDGSFFQVLEGYASTIDKLYATICRDPRHAGITRIIREPIARRSFSEWSMAFAGATLDQLNRITGLKDFFTSNYCVFIFL